MHMADALVSPVVGGAMLAVSAGAIVYSVIKTKDDLDEKKVPMMGVMGAFVFEAQMINFTIPATGSSGHIGGGILLSALLGPFPAFLTIKDMGSFVGQLLLRSIDRAERVFDAMTTKPIPLPSVPSEYASVNMMLVKVNE